MNADRLFRALIGLLHDVGKFRQRAHWDERLSHEEHGARWLEAVLAPRLTFLSPQDHHRLVEAVREHHARPYDRDARALVVADRLASGERVGREDEERGTPARDPLLSVLASVRLPDRPEPRQAWAYATVPLPAAPEGWEAVFPRPRATAGAEVDYPRLWNHFEEAVAAVHPDVWAAPERALHALMALLRAYAWCVPAATWRSEPDVSLYDHLRVTAALAVCVGEQDDATLARWEEQTGRGQFPDEPVALLVGGDLSGIQHFLYAVSSAGAAKSLRGRSAYLSLLSDAVVTFLRRELDLPPTQVIYNSGGHFYLLAPLAAQARVPELARQVTRLLVEAHAGDLALLLDALPLTGRDFRLAEQRLPERWAELTRRLGERKRQRFRDVLDDYYSVIVGPFGSGGAANRCDVCHAEAGTLPGGLVRRVEVDEGVRKCSLCRSFEELGDTIARRHAYLLFFPRTTPPARELAWHTVLARLGVDVHFWDEGLEPEEAARALVVRLNRATLRGDRLPVADFRWLPAFTPRGRNGAIVELEAMAAAAEGAHLWACLRADVDNLGLIFRAGLGARYSLSRVATLSHLLSLFFEGYINQLCARVDPQGRGLYLIYSGGDDLLLVGRWDLVLEAARRLRADFRRFVAHNPSFTASAGATLHRGKFPLYQAAAEAGHRLESAKGHRHPDGHTKDALELFGETMSWEEAEWVAEWQARLKEAIRADDLPRGFLHRLVRLAALPAEEERLLRSRSFTEAELARLVGYHRTQYRLVYTLARAPERARPMLERLREALLEDPTRRFLLLRVLTRWAELATRREA